MVGLYGLDPGAFVAVAVLRVVPVHPGCGVATKPDRPLKHFQNVYSVDFFV